jgi:nucleoside-diphosphate-sugar epimerase
MRVFVAGAAGAIGRRLLPLLLAQGHDVAGTTRSMQKAARLQHRGVNAIILDAFDRKAMMDVIARVRRDVVVHQLTDLPQRFDPAERSAALARNARLRREGTFNLMAAVQSAGVRRVVAQSIAFAYAPGPEPHRESDPLDVGAAGDQGLIAEGAARLEALVTGAPGVDGVVLRYGFFYGPGTWNETASGRAPVHVDAAAQAAVLALRKGAPGIYNIAEEDGAVSIDKARRELGWEPDFRLS